MTDDEMVRWHQQLDGITDWMDMSLIQVLELVTDMEAGVLQSRSDQISRSVVSDSLQPHGLQNTRPPSPTPTPRVYSDSLPSSW